MKKDMKKFKFNGKILIVFAIIAVCAITLFCIDFNANSVIEAGALKENYDYGEFTFLREMELSSGKTAYYYESGDEYYSYAHDNEGYVLIKDEDAGTLDYAINEGGKPVKSGVSYGSDKASLSKIVRMQGSDIDLTNPEVQENMQGLEGMTVIETAPVLASGTDYVSITNLTIFISFAGESFTPSTDLINTFNGSNTSLKSYYQEISNDRVNIASQIAYGPDGNVFVYRDSERRDYYNTNGSSRWEREVSLVTKAINSAKQYYSFSNGTNLDVNGDGYIDSLSIIVHGNSSSVWGSLLWPHSVSLDAVDGEDNYTVVNGKIVGNYSFNFSEDITLGVLCHETAHVLGAPDLYHYGTTSQNQDIITVGKWDLMEIDLDMPQYLLAYMRKNYIGGIPDSQIGSISENGTYSLKPVTATSESDIIAYKIPTSRDEYFMVEYRRVTESGYDSMLPGSGLIVYRVKEPQDFTNSRGNMDAVYRGTGNKADEVYVFRPAIKMTGRESTYDRYVHSIYDVGYAYLSPNNPYFSKVGKEIADGIYDFESIYYSDGSNSDIIIEALSISEDSIEFNVKLGQDMVTDSYFDDRIKLKSAELIDSTSYAGVAVNVSFGALNPQYLSALQVELQDAEGNTVVVNNMNLGRFLAEYNGGTREALSQFIYADKGNEHVPGIFSFGSFTSDAEPVKAVIKVVDADGDGKILDEIEISKSENITWDTILNAKTELKASIVASTRMTVGVRRDGSVDASGTLTTGQWAVENVSGITEVALGYTHTLLQTQGLNVIAVGDDNYGETQVSSWYNVTSVAAGTYCSYGLRNNGTVLAVGLNDKGQLNVSSWSGIRGISAMGKRVAGCTITGEVVVAGNFTDSEKAEIRALTNVKQIGVGLNYLVALKNDGNVQVIGTLPSADLSLFTNVVKVSAGAHHIVALTEDGRVVATGDNSYGQCLVEGLYDIIDVAAGEYHSAFLREDGVVEYRGTGSTKYGTNEGIDNLLYSNYVKLNAISGVTGISGGKIRLIKGASTSIGVIYAPTNTTYVRMLFTSSDELVATVEATSRDTATIIANEVGTSTLTIKDNGTGITYFATIEVYEEKPLVGIAFTEETRSIKKGESAYLSVIFLPEDGTYGTLKPTFVSSDSTIVSVNNEGLIVANGEVGQSAIITAEAAGFTAQIVINVVGDVSKIEVDLNGASTKYRYGEELDVSRYLLKVTIGGGEEIVAMTDDMVSGYNMYDKTSLSQTINVSYMGVKTSFEVSVKDYVVAVEKVSEPTKKYLYNYDLDAESGGFKVYMASGEVKGPNKFSANNYTGYRKNVIGVQDVIYTYTDSTWGTTFTFEEKITVVDYVNRISFTPLRNSYLYGEELDRHEFIDVNMISGVTRQVQLMECQVKDLNSDESDETSPLYALYSLRVGTHQVKITYVDPETGVANETTTLLNVEIDGEFQISGRDESAFCYYYEVGSDPYIGVTLVQSGAPSVVINKYQSEDDNLYFKIYSWGETETEFDNTITVKQDAVIKIFVKSQTLSGGEITIDDNEIRALSINATPLARTTAVKIKDGAVTSYKYGQVINGDKENLDILLEKTMEDGSIEIVEPMELSYDSEQIGNQTLKARYLGEWLEIEISINDYVTELLPISDVNVIWNGEITFDVYAIFARGGKAKINEKTSEEKGYVVSDYSNRIVGTQLVTVSYEEDDGVITTSFSITIYDEFYGITVKKEPRTEYELDEKFDPYKSTYVITMISGATNEISYNDEDFYYTPKDLTFTMATAGLAQHVYVYYKGEGADSPINVWNGACLLPDFVTQMNVVASTSKNEYSYGEELNISVRVKYAKDNIERTLKKDEYTTNYNSKKVGEQNITISYLYNGKIKETTFKVTVVDTITAVSIAGVPNRVSYGYGDVIDWTGAKVNVTYSAAGAVTYVGDEIKKNLTVTYSTLTSGQQRVTVSGGGVSAFFNISVTRESQSVEEKNTEKVKASLSKRQIALEDVGTIGEVISSLKVSNYLTAQYSSVQYGDLIPADNMKKSAGTGDKVIFVNVEGLEVFVFNVYLKGDVNGDGRITEADVAGMAGLLASGKEKVEVMDYNGDGKTNLTDLVGYARKTSGASPKQVPVNDVAKTIIATPSRLKNKENQYE